MGVEACVKQRYVWGVVLVGLQDGQGSMLLGCRIFMAGCVSLWEMGCAWGRVCVCCGMRVYVSVG